MEDELTCSICQEIFTDPVLLPCQHSFCRQCLNHLVNTRDYTVIPCPQCRLEVDLREQSVAELPLHRVLSNMAELYKTQESFKAHEISGQSQPCRMCDNHNEPYCLMCTTCQELMCLQCFGQHTNHRFSDIVSAAEAEKTPFQQTLDDCIQRKVEIENVMTEIQGYVRDIQVKKEHSKFEIRKAYNTALEVLNTWQRNALDDVDSKHDGLAADCQQMLTDLKSSTTVMQDLIIFSQTLLSGLDITFLENLKAVKTRMKSFSESVSSETARVREMCTKIKDMSQTYIIPESVFAGVEEFKRNEVKKKEQLRIRERTTNLEDEAYEIVVSGVTNLAHDDFEDECHIGYYSDEDGW